VLECRTLRLLRLSLPISPYQLNTVHAKTPCDHYQQTSPPPRVHGGPGDEGGYSDRHLVDPIEIEMKEKIEIWTLIATVCAQSVSFRLTNFNFPTGRLARHMIGTFTKSSSYSIIELRWC
jgi:hypothetical protein